MCGIAGFQGTFSKELLTAMSDRIAHRGPDGSGQIVIGNSSPSQTGLAHRRLAIIDLSDAAAQPFTTSCIACGVRHPCEAEDRPWLIYNGELYNYRELRAQLESSGHVFHSNSDTEVILHLYAERGLEMFAVMNGIFAFAIYEGVERSSRRHLKKGELLIVRDHMGVKPLYYSQMSNGFVFASELKALLPAGISKDPDFEALEMYLSLLYAPAPRTPLKSVSKLSPGHFAIVSHGKMIRTESYFDIPFDQPRLNLSYSEAVVELSTKFENAVKRQMVADVPIGAFLSGGVDSSTVVSSAARFGAEPIHCFTISDQSSGGQVSEDLKFARMVAKQARLPLTEVKASASDLSSLREMIYHLDEPQADPAALNTFLICKAARKEGLKVLLSGAGGDDLFSGYPRHYGAYIQRILNRTPRGIRALLSNLAKESTSGPKSVNASSFSRRFQRAFSHADQSENLRISDYFFNSRPEAIKSILGSRFAKEFGFDARAHFAKTLNHLRSDEDPLNKMLYLEMKHFLSDHNLNYVDKMSMANGVEVRVPLIDLELVQFCSRIAPQFKMHGFGLKRLFKDATAKLVPNEVMTRKKQGFGVSIHRWLLEQIDEIEGDVLSRENLEKFQLFNLEEVRFLTKRLKNGDKDAALLMLAVVSVQTWFQVF